MSLRCDSCDRETSDLTYIVYEGGQSEGDLCDDCAAEKGVNRRGNPFTREGSE